MIVDELPADGASICDLKLRDFGTSRWQRESPVLRFILYYIYDPQKGGGRTTMKSILSLWVAWAALAAAMADAAAQAPRIRTTPITPRAIALASAKAGAPRLTVTSPDFENMGTLDKKFMQATVGGENKAPAVAWSPGPPGTQSYALFAEGEGETRPDPTVHWMSTTSPPRPAICRKECRPTSTLRTRRVR